ncbi:GNAT family protein [uncultured Pseudokineococcus sp.]|uniref:GNAT family N-acetyltransferase n=1 Tax=uncultured Pseudokineococcus sp. TaxID=1642928 RepID=UPI00262845C8|nr:GNAT family protein [uncultured Pseudokineococcus sp.]
MVQLRPQRPDDLPLLLGADRPFDVGPSAPRTAPGPCDLEAAGVLTVLDDAGAVAGEVSWRWHEHRWGATGGSGCPVVAVWLRPDARGRGTGGAAVESLVELLLLHTTAHRVEGHADADDVAGQRALEAAGLVREGVARGARWRRGAHRDVVLHALVRTDRG